MLLLLASLANALDAPLAVERGWLAIEQGAPMEAVELARTALGDPEGKLLLYDGLVAAGMGARALVELEDVGGAEPPWEVPVGALHHALEVGDSKQTGLAARMLADAYPDHPELLIPLFDHPAPPAKLRRERNKLVDRVAQELGRRPEDPVFAWRARRLFLAAGRPLDTPHRVLQELGEPAAPERLPLGPTERAARAQQLANAPVALPVGIPAEQIDLVDRAAEVAFAEHRYDVALAWWSLLQGRLSEVEALEGRTRALLALDRPEEALEQLDQGLSWAADPWPDDVAGLASQRRAAVLVRLLEARAAALEKNNQPVEALADQATADQLAGRSKKSALEDRVRRAGVATSRRLDAEYGAPAPENALLRAEAAVGAGRHEEAVRHASDALFLYAWAVHGDWRVDCARAHAARAHALTGLDQLEAARLAWATALLLRPEAPADWWLAAARLHQDAGQQDLALSRYATAVARSDRAIEVPLEALTEGALGDPDAIARTLVIPVPSPEERNTRPKITRGQLYRFSTAAAVGAPARERERPPEVGETMPAWTLETPEGKVSSEEFRGRGLVLLFWTVQCDTCVQAIQQAGSVARTLREGGQDVAVVAVSMDEEQRYVDTLSELQRTRVTMAHDPDLGYRLGVERVPTMWIVDSSGTARFRGVGWHGTDAFEQALRQALRD